MVAPKRTLYLRNVPDDAVRRLASLQVNVFAARELVEAPRRADNASLLDALPDLPVPTSAITEALAAGRQDR